METRLVIEQKNDFLKSVCYEIWQKTKHGDDSGYFTEMLKYNFLKNAAVKHIEHKNFKFKEQVIEKIKNC